MADVPGALSKTLHLLLISSACAVPVLGPVRIISYVALEHNQTFKIKTNKWSISCLIIKKIALCWHLDLTSTENPYKKSSFRPFLSNMNLIRDIKQMS